MNRQRTVKYNQSKVDRLAYIDQIYATTNGWTVQLMNLYEERKRLRLEVSRMVKPDGGNNPNQQQGSQNQNRRGHLGTAKVR